MGCFFQALNVIMLDETETVAEFIATGELKLASSQF